MESNSWLSLVLGVLGVTGSVAFVLAYLKSSVTKTTIENYRGANEALEARIHAMEGDILEQKSAHAKCQAEMEGLKTVNQYLSNQMSALPAIEQVKTLLQDKFDDLIDGQDHMAEAVGGLVTDLRNKLSLDYDRREH